MDPTLVFLFVFVVVVLTSYPPTNFTSYNLSYTRNFSPSRFRFKIVVFKNRTITPLNEK